MGDAGKGTDVVGPEGTGIAALPGTGLIQLDVISFATGCLDGVYRGLALRARCRIVSLEGQIRNVLEIGRG